MKKHEDKLGRAAHIKRHTRGTSNEISFSVLDAAKNQVVGNDDKKETGAGAFFGHISLFTLPLRRKKTIATPTKEQGLHLSSGEFVSVDETSSTTFLGTSDKVSSVSKPTLALGASTQDTQKTTSRSSSTQAGRGGVGAVAGGGSSASSISSLDPEKEIARRKSRRRFRRVLIAATVIIVGLSLSGAGGWYLYKEHQTYTEQVTQLSSALDLVREADEVVVALDGLVADPLASDSLSSVDQILARIPEANTKLDEADKIARKVSIDLRDPNDKEAANQTVAAISARKALLSDGEGIMNDAKRADEASREMKTIWQDVVAADSLARDAAALVVETTEERVKASKEKSEQAAALFAATQTQLSDVEQAFPGVDLTLEKDYVAKRLEAMQYAIASDDAVLAKNKEEAVAQNDAYNTADADAAVLAAKLPRDPSQPVVSAFESVTASLKETYSTARSQAGTADAFIRDYLGTANK